MQKVETLIRHRFLWCLVWAGTVHLWPTKRTLDLYGLIFHNIKISEVQEPEN